MWQVCTICIYVNNKNVHINTIKKLIKTRIIICIYVNNENVYINSLHFFKLKLNTSSTVDASQLLPSN